MKSETNESTRAMAQPITERDPAVAIIVTGNAVEAIDIGEALRLRANVDHHHLRSIEAALDWMENAGTFPLCLVFGMRIAEGPAQRCIALAAERGVPVLLIADTQPPNDAMVVVQRPFSSEALDWALARIGL